MEVGRKGEKMEREVVERGEGESEEGGEGGMDESGTFNLLDEKYITFPDHSLSITAKKHSASCPLLPRGFTVFSSCLNRWLRNESLTSTVLLRH